MHLILWSLLWLIQTTPVTGTWVSIDDETGVEKSEITLYESEGKLYGKVKRLLSKEKMFLNSSLSCSRNL